MKTSIKLTGTLGKNPLVKSISSVRSVLEFPLAINERYESSNGERIEKTLWVKARQYYSNRKFTPFAKELKKGDLITISGNPNVETWISSDGEAKAQLVVKFNKFFKVKKA